MSGKLWKGLVIGLMLATCAGAEEPKRTSGVEWVNHYGRARRLSHQTNRPVLLFLSTDGCVHCTRMQNGALQDQRVVTHLRDEFVPAAIKVTGDSSLARDLNVTIYPTTVIIAPDGKILDYVRGYVTPEELSPRLANAVRAVPTSVASREE